jgi:hypothetical protein
MRITFTSNITGKTVRAIQHREFEDGSIVVSYVSEGPDFRPVLRRYRTLSPWHFTGLTLL